MLTLLLLTEHESVWTVAAWTGVKQAIERTHTALRKIGYSVIHLQIRTPEELARALRGFDPHRTLVFNWYEGLEYGAEDAMSVLTVLEEGGLISRGRTRRVGAWRRINIRRKRA